MDTALSLAEIIRYTWIMELKNFIVFADMDGTMLSDWDRGPYVPQRNIDGIDRLIGEGGAFSIASGRQYADSMSFFPRHFFNAPSVHANGAVIWDCQSDSILKQTPIPQSCKEELVEYTRRFKNLWLAAADEDRIYELDFGDERDGKLTDCKRPRTSIGDFFARDFLKACFILGDPKDMERVERDFAAMECAGSLNSSISSPIYFECYDRGVDKGLGVLEARRLSGSEGRKLVCIGDYFNYLSMLLAADIAACPANAPEGIKDVCQIITCSNNDGAIGELVERLAEL